MSEHMMPIPSRLYNAAVGGHVCGPEDLDFGQKVVHLIKYDRAGNEVSFESQVTQANKIYVIHDDFTLSSNVTIPANCVLEFDGGSISANSSADTLTLNYTELIGTPKIKCVLDGTIKNHDVYVDWFINAKDTNSNLENASSYIQGGFNVKPKSVIFSKGYYTLNDIIIKADVEIIGRETTIIPVEIEQNTYNFHFFKNVFNANVDLVTPQLVDNGVRNVTIFGFTFIGKGCGTFDGQLDQSDYHGDPVIHISTANNVVIENCVFKDIENAVRTRSWPNGNYGTFAGMLMGIWDVDNTIIRNIEQTNCRGDEQIFVNANHKDIYKTSVVYENNYAHDMRPGKNSSIFTTVCGNLLFRNNYVNNWNYGGSAFNLFGRNTTIEGNIVENSWCSSVFDTCEYGYFYNDKVVCVKNTVKVKNSIMLLYQSKVVDIRDNIFYGMIGCRSVNNPYGSGTYPYFYFPSNLIQTDIATTIENNVFDCTNYDNTIAAPTSDSDYRTGAIISTKSYNNIGNDSSAINISPVKLKAGNVLISNNNIRILENIPSNDPNNLNNLYPTPIYVRNLDKLTVRDNTFDGVYRTYGSSHGTIISVYNYPDNMDNFIPIADGESIESYMSNNKELLTYKEYLFIDNIINSTTYTANTRINAFYCFYRDGKTLPLIIDNMQVIHRGLQRIYPVESYNNVVVINGVYNGNLYYAPNIAINLIADVYDDEAYDIKTIGRLKRFAQYLDKDNNRIIIPSVRRAFYEKAYNTITEGTRIDKGEQFYTPSGYIYKNLGVVLSYNPSNPFPQPEPGSSNYTEFMYAQNCWWYKVGDYIDSNYRYVALTTP